MIPRNFRDSKNILQEFARVEDLFAKYQGLIDLSIFVSIIPYLVAFFSATNEMLNVYDSVFASFWGYFPNIFALLAFLQLSLIPSSAVVRINVMNPAGDTGK